MAEHVREPTRVAIRRTLEDVIHYQDLIFKLLRALTREKRPLREDEQDKFTEYVTRAFLGQGTKVKADGEFRRIIDVAFPNGVVIEDAEDALMAMSRLTTKVFSDDEGNEYDISELWKEATRLALSARKHAIKAAMAMSQEQWFGGGGVPADRAEGKK